MSTNKSPFKQAHLAIVSSAGTVGLAILCSRLLGFIRDIVIARLFGVYIYAQAFVIAFKIPNLLRDFVGEGATNAAFVPVFTEYTVKRTKEEFWELESDPYLSEPCWTDIDVLCDILLEICLDLEILDEDVYDMFPELWEPDYEIYPFWNDEW